MNWSKIKRVIDANSDVQRLLKHEMIAAIVHNRPVDLSKYIIDFRETESDERAKALNKLDVFCSEEIEELPDRLYQVLDDPYSFLKLDTAEINKLSGDFDPNDDTIGRAFSFIQSKLNEYLNELYYDSVENLFTIVVVPNTPKGLAEAVIEDFEMDYTTFNGPFIECSNINSLDYNSNK